METITLNQAHNALEGFIINHSHYNFWDEKSEETIMLNEVKAIKHKIELMIKKQQELLAAPL
jgi:hypothetical protein